MNDFVLPDAWKSGLTHSTVEFNLSDLEIQSLTPVTQKANSLQRRFNPKCPFHLTFFAIKQLPVYFRACARGRNMPTQKRHLNGDPAQFLARLMVLVLPLLVAGLLRAAEDDHGTPAAWTLMTAPGKGLRPGTRLAFGCPEATHNTDVLQRALALVPDGGTLVIPPGYFDVETCRFSNVRI